ncbi:AAA family ATPase [Amycolatopsis keratiniphila]|uniref:AAA family ATPase n=1 Tax=Amycolatopsis keratiniphila TaxID=129921 RepID=UPI0033EBD1EE
MAVKAPPYLLRLTVQNFRSLRSVDLELGRLNVLVGPNGAGKTNLLDVISFLGDSVREDLEPAIRRRGGMENILFRGEGVQPSARIRIAIEAAVTKFSNTKTTDKYTLTFRTIAVRSRGRKSRIIRRTEEFLFKRTAGRGRRITINGSDVTIMNDEELDFQSTLRETSLGLSTLPKLGSEQGGTQVDALAELFADFRVFEVDVNAARRPSPNKRSDKLQENGGNLAEFLLTMAMNRMDLFERLIEDARYFIPGLERLHFESVGGPTDAVVLKVEERGLTGLTDLADMSFGSIRALALLALLYDPNPPKLTCIEEIDHGLHPHVLDRLVELLREASSRTQLLIATHSPPLVNRLLPHELIVCERSEDASSKIPAIDSTVVKEMDAALDGQMGLGELWFTGALGGVPE